MSGCYCAGACRTTGRCVNAGFGYPQFWDWQVPVVAPRGCVCPPGSEATCQGHLCPRKAIDTRAYGTEGNGG